MWRNHHNSSTGLGRIHFLVFLLLSGSLHVASQTASKEDLSLEDRTAVEVVSVSRNSEPALKTASAIQVITGDEIRRSGATNLPEVLRLFSNLQVAQVGSHDWAVTTRGFNAAPLGITSFANKVLVLIDGRSVYTPVFGGVFWDAQNVILEDIDRIEVISGGAAAVWGQYAMNGVINVITKKATKTQGLYAEGGGGSLLQKYMIARQGVKVGRVNYRLYGSYFDRDGVSLSDGEKFTDGWTMADGGIRVDYHLADSTEVTIQGGAYFGQEGDSARTELSGQHLLMRWTHPYNAKNVVMLQGYFDRTNRRIPTENFTDELITGDFEALYNFGWSRHFLTGGAGYRFMIDQPKNSPLISFQPESKDLHMYHLFLQDQTSFLAERLNLALAVRLERALYSGIRVIPGGRASWQLASDHRVWLSASGAVRSPSRFDAEGESLFIFSDEETERNFSVEKALSYELGYCYYQPGSTLSLSVASFYTTYKDLRSVNFNDSPPPFFVLGNDLHAKTWGLEVSVRSQPASWWIVHGGYTLLGQDFSPTVSEVVPDSELFESITPMHQIFFRSTMNLPLRIRFDMAGRLVGSLPETTFTPGVPSYFTFDTRLAWSYRIFEVSLVGQNLAQDQHPEFGSLEIPRSFYGKLGVRL